MHLWSTWIVAGILLFILEMFVPGFVIASLGFGAITAGFAATFQISFKLQLLFFCLGTLVSFFTFRPIFLRFEKKHGGLKTGVDALVGRTALVIQEIDSTKGTGRVKIGGEEWKAVTPDSHKTVSAGEFVSVLSVEGVKVVVEIIEKEKENV